MLTPTDIKSIRAYVRNLSPSIEQLLTSEAIQTYTKAFPDHYNHEQIALQIVSDIEAEMISKADDKKAAVDWLRAFTAVWDFAADSPDLSVNAIDGLRNILENYCKQKNLPYLSADDLVHHILKTL